MRSTAERAVESVGREGRFVLPEELATWFDIERKESVGDWRSWAQFVYLGGGPAELPDEEMRRAICAAQDAFVFKVIDGAASLAEMAGHPEIAKDIRSLKETMSG